MGRTFTLFHHPRRFGGDPSSSEEGNYPSFPSLGKCKLHDLEG
jgi:hypothetical protein